MQTLNLFIQCNALFNSYNIQVSVGQMMLWLMEQMKEHKEQTEQRYKNENEQAKQLQEMKKINEQREMQLQDMTQQKEIIEQQLRDMRQQKEQIEQKLCDLRQQTEMPQISETENFKADMVLKKQ